MTTDELLDTMTVQELATAVLLLIRSTTKDPALGWSYRTANGGRVFNARFALGTWVAKMRESLAKPR